MRDTLKNARRQKGFTQQQLADRLLIGLRHYKKLESGETLGSIWIWDALEDLLGVNQRALRENRPGPADNPQTHPECPRSG